MIASQMRAQKLAQIPSVRERHEGGEGGKNQGGGWKSDEWGHGSRGGWITDTYTHTNMHMTGNQHTQIQAEKKEKEQKARQEKQREMERERETEREKDGEMEVKREYTESRCRAALSSFPSRDLVVCVYERENVCV